MFLVARPGAPIVAFLLLVAMPFAPSSFLFYGILIISHWTSPRTIATTALDTSATCRLDLQWSNRCTVMQSSKCGRTKTTCSPTQSGRYFPGAVQFPQAHMRHQFHDRQALVKAGLAGHSAVGNHLISDTSEAASLAKKELAFQVKEGCLLEK